MRAILTYHSIEASGSPISLDQATFERHVAFFRSGAVDVLALDELADAPDGRNALALTFDDGFENFASQAWPLLRAAKLPVTLFVASRRVGTDNAWGGSEAPGIPTLPLLDWAALRELVGQGLQIGSHSRSHPFLSRLSDEQLALELRGSAEDLERELGVRPRSFCYPYGDLDARVVEAARREYALACTTELDLLRADCDKLRLPRLDAFYYRAPGRLEAWGGNSFRAHLWLRASARRLRASWRR
ncbi:MAG: polysaccharide deacetylase family protein [Planctomycetes bacterium]|nr:polysaccharide deacetylase family protein [Planctomycetota bacterium]